MPDLVITDSQAFKEVDAIVPSDVPLTSFSMLLARQKGDLQFTWTSGTGFPESVGDFKLAVHCGGCMINRRKMFRRLDELGAAGVPVVNYGVLLAKVHGVLDRALGPFPCEKQVLAGV